MGVILSQASEDAESQLTTAAAACPITGVLWGTITLQMWDEYSLVSCRAVTFLRNLFAYAVIYLPFQTPKLTLPCYLVKFQCFPPRKCLSDHFVLNLRCQRSNGFLVCWRARELTLCECVFNYSLCAGEGGSQKVGQQIWENVACVITHKDCSHCTCTVRTLATGSSDDAPPTPHPQTQPWNTCCGHWLICELYCREDLLMWATKCHEDPFSEIAKYHR